MQVLLAVPGAAEKVGLAVLAQAAQEQAGRGMLVVVDVPVIQVLAAEAAVLHLLDLHVLFPMAAPAAMVQHHQFQGFQSHMLTAAAAAAEVTAVVVPAAVAAEE